MQHFEIADDRGEQIVEVVRDAAGELAHGLHLLRLAQLGFHAAHVGQIDRGQQHMLDAPVIAGKRHQEGTPRNLADGKRGGVFVLDRLSCFDSTTILHGGEFRLFTRQDFLQRLAHYKVAGITGMALPGGVGVLADDAAIWLDDHEHQIDRRVLEDRAVAGTRAAQLIHHLIEGLGAVRDFAFELFRKAAECAFGVDALADVSPVDRDAVARRTDVHRDPDARCGRGRLERDRLPFFTHAAQHLFVQAPDHGREALPDDVADHLCGGGAPEFERAPVGVNEAPFAIEGVERIPHAFQDRLRIG